MMHSFTHLFFHSSLGFPSRCQFGPHLAKGMGKPHQCEPLASFCLYWFCPRPPSFAFASSPFNFFFIWLTLACCCFCFSLILAVYTFMVNMMVILCLITCIIYYTCVMYYSEWSWGWTDYFLYQIRYIFKIPVHVCLQRKISIRILRFKKKKKKVF